MNATLKKRYEESKADVQKLWAQFSDEKARVEEAGSEAEAVDKLKAEFYDPYLKAVDEHGKNEDAYRKAVEMEAGPRLNGNSDPGDEDDHENKADGGDESISAGERVTSSAQYKAMRASWDPGSESARPHLPPIRVLDNTELKTLLTGGGAPGTQLLRNIRLPGFLPVLRQNLQIAQLVTVREVSDGSTVEWVRHSATTNNAAEVAEATATTGTSGTKPESAITFVVENTPIRTIAHWIPATRQALADMPMLRGIIDDELVDGVLRRVNTQMINGDGIAPNLAGVLNTAGIGTQAIGTDSAADAVFKAITVVRTAFFEPTAIVMNPADWQDIRLSKSATSGDYFFGPPYASGEDALWGLRVVLDQTIAAGTALVGDWRRAVLYVRDGVSVLTSDSHSDFFVRNMIVILAEGRYGFAVERPTAFVKVTGI